MKNLALVLPSGCDDDNKYSVIFLCSTRDLLALGNFIGHLPSRFSFLGLSIRKSVAISRNCSIEAGFEVVDDFLSKNARIREIVGFFEAFVSEPKNIMAAFFS